MNGLDERTHKRRHLDDLIRMWLRAPKANRNDVAPGFEARRSRECMKQRTKSREQEREQPIARHS